MLHPVRTIFHEERMMANQLNQECADAKLTLALIDRKYVNKDLNLQDIFKWLDSLTLMELNCVKYEAAANSKKYDLQDIIFYYKR